MPHFKKKSGCVLFSFPSDPVLLPTPPHYILLWIDSGTDKNPGKQRERTSFVVLGGLSSIKALYLKVMS